MKQALLVVFMSLYVAVLFVEAVPPGSNCQEDGCSEDEACLSNSGGHYRCVSCDCKETAQCYLTNGWNAACNCSLGTPGYQGTTCEDDINECTSTSSPDDCPASSTCTNNQGSFSCTCWSGYEFNSDSTACDNINECDVYSETACQGELNCVDLVPGYRCNAQTPTPDS